MSEHQIANLQSLVKAAKKAGNAPVEEWDPPYCGDIGLRISRSGVWFYRDSEIQRPAIVKLFARVLRCDPDGRHFLVTPGEKVDVIVEDAPFMAVEMDVQNAGQPDQQISFRTNVDDIVPCGPDRPLRFRKQVGSGGLKPYVLVRGRLEALLTRALTVDLMEIATPADASAGSVDKAAVGETKPDALQTVTSDGATFTLEAE
ncbi:MAG: DUF1285 domain-containing protein [Pseudomonadota bacterium]